MSIPRTLRPIVVLVLAAFVLASAGFGQTRRHDLSVSAGVLSMDQLSDIFTDIITVVLTMGTFSKNNQEYSAVPFLTYHYSANSRFGFGAAIGGYSASGDLQILGDNVGTFKERNYIGAVELDYHWIMREGLQIYSGAGFGLRYRRGTYRATETDTFNKLLPTFHINALGVRFGRKIAVFLEAGAGYKGVLSAGLNAQF
ncbi:MAG TPA: hypothetical protein VKT17_10935 [Acidobacteriota bacterium]|nr:hypothetical protein [Acidobacteriota bacterium]